MPSGWLDLPAAPLDLNGPQAIPYPAAGTDWTGHSIVEHFRRLVETDPDRVAVDDGDRRLTRRQVWNGACRLGVKIAASTPPGPIGILLPNEAGYATAVFGCLAAGRPCVVLDRHYPAVRNRAITADAGLAGVIIDTADAGDPTLYPSSLAAVALGDPAELDRALIEPPTTATALRADDPAVIVYTSGSTGAPKGIVLSQRAILHRTGQLIDSLHMGPNDVSLPLGSPCTVAGMLQLFESLLSGGLLLKLDLQRIGLGAVLDAIGEKHATLLFATPALLRVMARLDGVRDRLASLRSVHPSGEVVIELHRGPPVAPGKLLRRLAATGRAGVG
jgi:non-ribosomal peptide synthetase component F